MISLGIPLGAFCLTLAAVLNYNNDEPTPISTRHAIGKTLHAIGLGMILGTSMGLSATWVWDHCMIMDDNLICRMSDR